MAELKNLIVNGDTRLIGDTTAGNITATKITTSGGTSSQFIKGDGSLDSNTYAPLNSPGLTGTPTAPTAAASTSTTQVATTAFVSNLITPGAGTNSIILKGDTNTAAGPYSTAEGYNNDTGGTATSNAKTPGSNTAAGAYAHVEGNSNIAQGRASHAEGAKTFASGSGSHSEGYNTTASGDYSHAEGAYTMASGPYSHSTGYNTIAGRDYKFACGLYNYNDSGIFNIGNGYLDGTRQNAVSVFGDGSVFVYGVGLQSPYNGKLAYNGCSLKSAIPVYIKAYMEGNTEQAMITYDDWDRYSIHQLTPWDAALQGLRLEVYDSEDGEGSTTSYEFYQVGRFKDSGEGDGGVWEFYRTEVKENRIRVKLVELDTREEKFTRYAGWDVLGDKLWDIVPTSSEDEDGDGGADVYANADGDDFYYEGESEDFYDE